MLRKQTNRKSIMPSFFSNDACQWKRVTKYAAANIRLFKMCCKQQKLFIKIYGFKLKNNYNKYVWGSEESWCVYSKMFVFPKTMDIFILCLCRASSFEGEFSNGGLIHDQVLHLRLLRRQSKTRVSRIWLGNVCDNMDVVTGRQACYLTSFIDQLKSLWRCTGCEIGHLLNIE